MRELLPWGGHHLYHRFVAKPLERFYARLATRMPPGRVLDIGCGPGILAEALRQQGRDVVAVDKDPTQVKIARRNHPDLDVRQGAAEAVPLEDASFDVVVTSESYHHWSDREAGINEAHRVLRPGGALVIIEGCGDVTKEETRAFWGKRTLPGFTLLSRFVFRSHGFTPEALQQEVVAVLEASPFGSCHVERVDGWWWVQA